MIYCRLLTELNVVLGPDSIAANLLYQYSLFSGNNIRALIIAAELF